MSAQSSENNVLGLLGHFSFNFKHILIDEIALEGLEGIGLDLLWKRVEHRISSPLTEKMKARFWGTIVNTDSISLYQLPEPVAHSEILDRFSIIDNETGDIKDAEFYIDGPYEYCPVPNEFGSCKHYATRKWIPNLEFHDIPYGKMLALYGDTLVMVASLEERWQALAKHLPMTVLHQLTHLQYCILELVGKSRVNGQMTTGKTNLTNIIKEPKSLFYNRNMLKKFDLIKVLYVTQFQGVRCIKNLLLRLKRFHKPRILSMPKVGRIHDMMEYLRTKPNYAERTDIVLKNKLITQPQIKRLKKTNNVFDFEEKIVDNDEPPRKRTKKCNPSLVMKRRYIFVAAKSDDESSQSEDENTESGKSVKCQYHIGVGLLRQAYERFLEAGTKGLSQSELGAILGIEFYTTRMLCKTLTKKKIVKEFFEDKGKQRISKYVALAADNVYSKYDEEKKKFLDYINQSNENGDTQKPPDCSQPEADTKDDNPNEITDTNDAASRHITEIRGAQNTNVKTLLESKRGLTLRQLKFGNGILKIVNERKCITGYQTLSNLVAKDINEAPMVTKALKSFLQKLADSGHIKIFKIRWPGVGNEKNFMNITCAPHIKATDPLVRSKYKEVYLRAMGKKQQAKKEPVDAIKTPLAMFIHPRYMKMQKLHEFIIKMAYFDPLMDVSNGFMTVPDVLPEITVKFAISLMSTIGVAEISHLRIQEQHIDTKLHDAPPEISHSILKCKSLRNSFRTNLKALAMLGLIQLVYQPNIHSTEYEKNLLNSFRFYVNRNAKIINTTGNWPRKTADTQSLERKYRFETFDDVQTYWRDVYEISIGTNILTKDRMKKTLSPPVRREEDYSMFDNGDRYGDGLGPCGFDACFYMEIGRLWRTFYVREPKIAPALKKKPQIKIPKQKTKKPKKPKKVVVPKMNPIVQIKTPRHRKRVCETATTWTKEDDNLIVLCQAAITIASPTSQPGCLRVRNMVAKEILNLRDPKKSPSVCHRRALMLQRSSNKMHEKDSLLNEMRRRRPLIQKYEGLIKKLRLRYSANMAKFMNEARIPLLELVYLIWQVSISESYNRKLPCVALDVESFYENYTIVPATATKLYNMYKAPELAPLREGVFLTIMWSLNNELKSGMAKKIYSIFKMYPENTLRIVVDQLRRSGAISAKEKLLNNQMHRLHLEDIVQSAYKISANYQRKWIGRLNSEFIVVLAKHLDKNLPQFHIKGSAELNCVFLELQACNLLKLQTSAQPAIVDGTGVPVCNNVPLNVVDIEAKHKLRSGSLTWKSNPDGPLKSSLNVSALYANTEFDAVLMTLAKNAVVYINESQEYDLNDEIIKLLHEKGTEGSTFKELQAITGSDTKRLKDRLQQLESEKVIKRVGFNENKVILMKYIKDWSLNIEDKHIIVTPWLTMQFDIRYEILMEWTGIIMNKIFESPGCSISYLSDTFELITCRAVQDACMFLENAKCITLQILKYNEPDLFSDDDDVPEFTEFNLYESPERIVAFPVKDSFTKYAYLRKMVLDKYVRN